VAIVLLSLYLYVDTQVKARKSHSLIAPSDIELKGVSLEHHYGWRFHGIIKNNSAYTISSVTVRIKLEYCDSNKPCDIVGDEDLLLYGIIPPGQSRDESTDLFPNGVKDSENSTNWTWEYEIKEITAQVE
jgi:hypothetical protein